MEVDRRLWLEQLAAACERVLEDEDGPAALHADVGLLARLRTELDELGA
jgi:hypothetical protein